MPIDRNDEDRLMRAMARMLDERVGPVAKRVEKHSGQIGAVREEVSPAVLRKMSESQHDIDDRSQGFERMVLKAIGQLEEKVDKVTASIPPAAAASRGAELAAVAGAQAMVRTEGKTDAVQVAANRADENSTVARVRSSQTLLILIGGIILQAAYNAWQHVAHMVSP